MLRPFIIPIKLSILVAFLVFSITGCAQQNQNSKINMQTSNNKNDEAQVLALLRQFTQWMIDRNTAEMNKIVDKNFTLTHITGYVQPKQEWFEEIEKESMKYYSYKEVKTSVKINGSQAEFVGQNLLDARIWGSRNNWRLQQTMQLEKRNGNWMILKSVATTFLKNHYSK